MVRKPTLVAPGGIVEYGKYIQALENTPLSPVAWSDEHDTFIYRPPLGQPNTFAYRRAAYLPDVPNDDFAVAGTPQEQDPLLLLHRPSATNAFQASLAPPPHAGGHGLNFNAQPLTVVGPSFVHWLEQMVNISPTVPSRVGILSLEMPDLEAHRAELANSGPPESWSNSEQWVWWSGDWARDFIQQTQTGQPLPPLDKPTVWSSHRRVWGLNVRLAPIRESVEVGEVVIHPEDDAEPEAELEVNWAEGLESYRIFATVNEVYVSPQFFEDPE
ncbi:hypothetical protein EWM64_g3717 [Hericium alpestre]|uniref:Uncharacterized protein n=1 Tax=Hericium alpestre TaxID=135208 RepID=A0A4Z0A1S1_9AGAM|nr:hypothetical protein EWM64_g3717 [Hericium alpestre]